MNLIWRKRGDDNVVASVEEQTAAAAELARIDGQDRLTNPRTNPAVRGHADQLRDQQHRLILDDEHTRLVRRHRVSDQRADHAERALEAIQSAREASSAARSVLALHQGRTRFMGATLAASLTLSSGSAMGVAALARQLHAPGAVGYIAEVGLTGLTTTVILYRSHLAQHGGQIRDWKSGVLWLLMVAPLAASMVANAFGSGPVGIACSVGAAAFSLLSYVIADASSEALRIQAERVTGEDESKLREIATGIELNQPRTSTVKLNHEPVNPEVHEPEPVQVPLPQVRNLPLICSVNLSSALPSPRNLNREPEVQNQPDPELPEPESAKSRPKANREPRTANLGDRAARKAAEEQQVLNLIGEQGLDAVSLSEVMNRFGFTKTTGYHRLTAARELWNQNREPANRNQAGRDDEPEPVRVNLNHTKEASG